MPEDSGVPPSAPPADAPGTQWTLGTSIREPNLETKAWLCGQILMDIVSPAARQGGEAHKGPKKGAEGGRLNGPGLHMPRLPRRRPSHGEVCWAIVRGPQDVSHTRWSCAV